MKLTPTFQNLDYTARVLKPNVTYTVTRMSHNAIGGPRRAEITVSGNMMDLWEYVEYMGCPVEIRDEVGRLAWWGYVYESRSSNSTAKLYCRGWWDKLSWRYYLNSGTNSVATTTQISAIVANMATFVTAVDIDTASGINTVETRDGKRRGQEEIEELLQAGTTNSKRLLATINHQRRMRVYEEPASLESTDFVFRGEAEVGASFDTMANKIWANWSEPGGGGSHNTAAVTDADSAAAYGEKSEQITLSAASAALAEQARNAELARRKYPVPTIELGKGDVMYFTGVKIPPYMVTAGQWLRLRDVIPQSVDTSRLADVSKIFIEEAEWSAGGKDEPLGKLRITPRDVPGRYQGANL